MWKKYFEDVCITIISCNPDSCVADEIEDVSGTINPGHITSHSVTQSDHVSSEVQGGARSEAPRQRLAV